MTQTETKGNDLLDSPRPESFFETREPQREAERVRKFLRRFDRKPATAIDECGERLRVNPGKFGNLGVAANVFSDLVTQVIK